MVLASVATTLWQGLECALRRSPWQPIFLPIYTGFVGHAVEAAAIDRPWRRFYLLLAVLLRPQRPAA